MNPKTRYQTIMEFNPIPSGSLYTTPPPSEEKPAPAKPEKPNSPPPSDSGNSGWASFISTGFSPLLMPTYCAMIALWATRLSSAPEGARLSSAVVILLLSCFLPLAALLAAVRLGKITDTRVRSRRQRTYLYPVAIVAYILCAWYLVRVHAPMWLTGFFLGISLSSILAFIINFKWKISAHAAGCGGFIAFMFFIAVNGLSELFFLPWLSGAVIISGAVITSRLFLKAHTLMQVAAGFAAGLVCVSLMMFLLY